MSDVVEDALPVEFTSQTVRTNGHGTKTGYETVVRTERPRVDANKLPMFSIG